MNKTKTLIDSLLKEETNYEKHVPKVVSEMLNEIKDKSLENILRYILFNTSTKINWEEASKIIKKQRPEYTWSTKLP